MERGTIEVAPLAFMRGRTLNDSFIILDEAQNTTPEQMQMFLTRLGFGSKVVVTGDVTQIDLPRDQASGLIQVRDILARDRRDRASSSSATRTSSATSSCSGSSRRTSATPRRPAPRGSSRLMIDVEVDNRSGADGRRGRGDRRSPARVLARRGRRRGRARASRSSGADEMRALKREHLGDRRGDRRALVPARRARRAAGGRCRARSATSSSAREVVGDEWRWPLVHGLLHLLGYEHGDEMEARERVHLADDRAPPRRRRSSTASTTRSRGSCTCCARSGTCASTS